MTLETPSRPPSNNPWLLRATAGLAIAAAGLAIAIGWTARPPAIIESVQPAAPTAPAAPAAAPAVQAAPAEERPPATYRHGIREPKAKPAGVIRIASYNVENLFDDKDDPKLADRNEDAGMTKPDEACRAVAEAILRTKADVVVLQEIESYDALIWFRDKYLKDAGFDHVISLDAGDARGIECAVISKFPLGDAKVWPGLPLGGIQPDRLGRDANPDAGKPITFHRSPLRVTMTVPAAKVAELRSTKDAKAAPADAKDQRITFFAIHQKSGAAGYWREREATKTVELAQEYMKANPGEPVLLMGDMNAIPGSEPIEIYTRPAAGAEPLVDLFADRSDSDPQWITHSSGRVIDFIFANPAAAKRIVKDTRFILSTPDRPAKTDWRTTPTPKGWASDHLPVVVDLEV